MEDIKVGDITVELPKPIHMPGLRAKLDVFAADHDKIHKWVGSSNIATLFYLYLFYLDLFYFFMSILHC